MKPYKIITDSCCDITKDFIEKNQVPYLGLIFNFKGNSLEDDFGATLTHKEFYDEVRKGELPTTSQVNVYRFEEIFKKYILEGFDIIYIAFSSALSGTYSSAVIAKDTILEEFPTADITVIDSRSASMGEGLINYYAYEMMNNGATKEEIVNWVENNKFKVNHWFTVDDLNHLKRGGRVSAASAVIGTILDIKPILHVDDEGRLIPVTKVKGRKKSIRHLAETLKARIVDPENQVIGISHGDCIEDAKLLEKLIRDEVQVRDVLISTVGPAVGSHSGPGTLALFFIGENRHI
jgi:DegV family protein with EDD domain